MLKKIILVVITLILTNNIFTVPRIGQVDNSTFGLNTKIKIYVSPDTDRSLDKSNFRVYEKIKDGNKNKWVLRKIDDFKKPGNINEGINFLLLLDVSGSMAGRKIEAAKKAVITFIKSMRKKDKVMIMTFGYKLKSSDDFSADKVKSIKYVLNEIGSIRHNAPTPLYHSVDNAIRKLKKINGRKVIILLSDGVNDLRTDGYNDLTGFNNNIPNTNLNDNVNQTRISGVPVYSIGFECNTSEMSTLSKNSGGEYFPYTKEAQLPLLYEKIRKTLLNQYKLTFNTDIGGFDVRNIYVKINNVKSNIREFYAGSILGQKYKLSPYLLLVLVSAFTVLFLLYLIKLTHKNKISYITVLKGKSSKKKVELNGIQILIGRDEKSDLGLFGDKKVDFSHAKIIKHSNGKYTIENVSNVYPLYVNREVTDKTYLKDGSVVQIGNSVLLFNEKDLN